MPRPLLSGAHGGDRRKGDVDRDEPFDEKFYQERYSVERTFAWKDSFRSVLNRFDTTATSWKGFNFLAFMVIAIKKFKKTKNSREPHYQQMRAKPAFKKSHLFLIEILDKNRGN